MISRVDRKPTFPAGTVFLNSWTIHRPIYCVDSYEIYKLQDNSEPLFGLAICCKTSEDALEQSKHHLSWWRLLGKKRLKVLANNIITKGEWNLVLASVAFPQDIVSLEELQASPLTQAQVQSLIMDLIGMYKLGYAHGVCPVTDMESVLLIRQNKSVNIIPPFVKTSELPLESKSVEVVAKTAYLFITGVDISKLTSTEYDKRTSLPPANQWNRNIDERLSLLLELCINKQGSEGISSLDDLEIRLRHLSENDITRKTLSTDSSQKDIRTASSQGTRGLAKVAGMAKLKALLVEEVVQAIRNPEPFKRYGLTIPNGILLYGPPGCGKTFIAKLLAEELGWYFREVKGSDVGSIYIHGSVLSIRDLFAEAEEHAPAMIFIDEIDGLVPKRSEMSGIQQYKSEEVNEFLVHLNECASKKIFIIAATNELNKIDDAILRPGRLDKIIYVGPPDFEARKELLIMYLSDRPQANLDIENFAEILDGYSCSDIRNIIDESARLALREGKPIDNEHLKEAIRRNPSSLSSDILSKYKNFQQRGI